MSKEKKKDIDLNTTEGKELLSRTVKTIQRIDESIARLKEEKSSFIKEMKDEGLNTKVINSIISNIRKELKKNDMEASEENLYHVIIEELNIVRIV